MWLIALGVATLFGVLLGDFHPLAVMPLVATVILAVSAAVLTRSRPRVLALATLALSIGLLRASTASPPPADWALAAPLKERANAAIHTYMPDPQASLAAGVLLGGSGGLTRDVRLALRRSGLAHILAIDGYKQVMLAGVAAAVGTRALGAYWGRLPVLAAVAVYTLLTGAHPSAVRSGLMVALASLALLRGRSADALTSLVVATTLMALADPRVLLDVGMQLSVSATLGIILFWPALRRRLRGIPRWVAEPAGLTLAVGVATLPIELAVFQSVSLVSPVAHIVATPLVGIVFAATALVAVLAPAPLLAHAAAAVATLAASALLAVVRSVGALPGAALGVPGVSPVGALALSAALLLAGLWPLAELRPVREAFGRYLRSGPTTSAARQAARG